ncbi:MAG: hypothetical protein AAF517_03105 [Planctomycetota bacterium]
MHPGYTGCMAQGNRPRRVVNILIAVLLVLLSGVGVAYREHIAWWFRKQRLLADPAWHAYDQETKETKLGKRRREELR